MRFNAGAKAESLSFSPARGARFHQETRLVTFTMFSSATVRRAPFILEFIHRRAAGKESVFAHLSRVLLLSVGGILPNDLLLSLTALSLCF